MSQSTFRLKVRQIDQSCVFDLSSAQGEESSATVKYPDHLNDLYQNWQQLYRRRYELFSRARIGRKSGSGTPTNYDWDQELRTAEAAFLNAFDYWLGQSELLEIRETIQRRVEQSTKTHSKPKQAIAPVDILLECSPIDLVRLPWETWKLVPRHIPSTAVRIARTCPPPVPSPAPLNRPRSGKIRILAIFAAAPDLNHDIDQKLLRSLQSLAHIEFLYCNELAANDQTSPGSELKQRIADTIADPRGWDLLFFAGHSDESAATGGKLELAPHTALSICEIEPQLMAARQRGLQLAVFNSCCGLHIADSLIRLGIPQVVVMRERIQDAIAHKFLEQFCHSLSRYQDVHTAVMEACQYFATENISYPSAHLIPSLFRHPDPKTPLFKFEPSAIKRMWQRWQPTRWEAIAVGTVAFASFVVPFQEFLMDGRYWSQAAYRHATNQLGTVQPKSTILKIDQASIDRKGINAYQIKPMSRAYLAELIDRLRQLNVPVIGIDYLLDGSTKEDRILATAVQQTIQQGSQFIFATRRNDAGQPIQVNSSIIQPHFMLQGDIDFYGWDVMLPRVFPCQENCPFAYQLALAQLMSPKLKALPSSTEFPNNLQNQVNQALQNTTALNHTLSFLKRPELLPGLQPVIDFSLPPNRAYQSIAAWDFLERPLEDEKLRALQQQIVIIGAGGYDQADDNFSAPFAVKYWRSARGQWLENDQTARSQVLPGVTVHAYGVHHLLTQHLLLPIPTFWMIGIAIILGKATSLLLIASTPCHQRRWIWLMVGGTIVYGLIGLQTYVTVAIVLPWFLPSTLFWLYVLSALKQQTPQQDDGVS